MGGSGWSKSVKVDGLKILNIKSGQSRIRTRSFSKIKRKMYKHFKKHTETNKWRLMLFKGMLRYTQGSNTDQISPPVTLSTILFRSYDKIKCF